MNQHVRLSQALSGNALTDSGFSGGELFTSLTEPDPGNKKMGKDPLSGELKRMLIEFMSGILKRMVHICHLTMRSKGTSAKASALSAIKSQKYGTG